MYILTQPNPNDLKVQTFLIEFNGVGTLPGGPPNPRVPYPIEKTPKKFESSVLASQVFYNFIGYNHFISSTQSS